MIRRPLTPPGPSLAGLPTLLPQSRDGLWELLAGRLDAIERGLVLVSEMLDCSAGQLGAVDGLARDAAGAPVLLLVASAGDTLLTARALGAVAFLERVGDAFAQAVPEGSFCPGAAGRVVVVATDAAGPGLDLLARAPVPGLHVCRLEPFRVNGSERFAVRWAGGGTGAGPGPGPRVLAAPSFSVPEHLQPLWTSVHTLCSRIDAGVRIDGDRYQRRITWNGRVLGEVHVTDASLCATLPDGSSQPLGAPSDVRGFVDQVLRRYAAHAGLALRSPTASADGAVDGDADGDAVASGHRANDDAAHGDGALGERPRGGAPSGRRADVAAAGRAPEQSLRSALAAAALTPEEQAALGAPAASAGAPADACMAGDAARGLAARDRSRTSPPRTD